MSKNPSFGKWTEEETNWSKKDAEFIEDVLAEEPVPTSYDQLLTEYESSLLTC